MKPPRVPSSRDQGPGSEGLRAERLAIMDPRWQVVLKVAELGSLTRAATSFDLPQSVISRQIAQLEQQCGERLFRRTGRGVAPTEFGEQLFPRVKTLLDQASQLSDDIRTSGGVPVGEVSVGLLPSTVAVLAAPLLMTARDQLPGVRLHLMDAPSARLEEHLREGRIDMALVVREDYPDAGGPVVARLALRLVGRRGDALLDVPAIPFDALADFPLIVPRRPHLLRVRLEDVAARRQVRLRFVGEADSVGLQTEIAAAGAGYAIASDPSVSGDTRLASAPIVEPVLKRAIVLETTPHRPHTRASREVHRLVLALASRLTRQA